MSSDVIILETLRRHTIFWEGYYYIMAINAHFASHKTSFASTSIDEWWEPSQRSTKIWNGLCVGLSHEIPEALATATFQNYHTAYYKYNIDRRDGRGLSWGLHEIKLTYLIYNSPWVILVEFMVLSFEIHLCIVIHDQHRHAFPVTHPVFTRKAVQCSLRSNEWPT